ncbi:alpha/beta fold hydrolase [Kiloniella sp. EL199]|uniref:alpha/beta fold hydrolase n=1 Tax=Kiloniella sp. EL199 TaxID=2107581 RepID=UPI0013C40A15|nr:alpha/beta hydrolase [Kiloniella sp. EL199]
MRIVLLPGLDGTGNLFAPFLEQLNIDDVQVISLPDTGSQDYETLTSYVERLLPNKPFVLVAESFSGPIAALLSLREMENLKGIVFVATFLSNPNPLLLSVAKYLPLKFMANMPFSSAILRTFLLGKNADDNLLSLFRATLEEMSPTILRARLKSLATVKLSISNDDLPTSYILPLCDCLVCKSKVREFEGSFAKIEMIIFEGPHFILQSKCNDVKRYIANFIENIQVA